MTADSAPPLEIKCNLRFRLEGDLVRDVALLAKSLKLLILKPWLRKVEFESERPGALVGVPGEARNSRYEINANLAGFNLANGTSVLSSDADTLVTVFEDIDIVNNQHRLWRCDCLWYVVIEMVLNGVVFSRTVANEPPDSVLVNGEPFADSTECFVDTGTDQTFHIC
jgi:hypothetical protein